MDCNLSYDELQFVMRQKAFPTNKGRHWGLLQHFLRYLKKNASHVIPLMNCNLPSSRHAIGITIIVWQIAMRFFSWWNALCHVANCISSWNVNSHVRKCTRTTGRQRVTAHSAPHASYVIVSYCTVRNLKSTFPCNQRKEKKTGQWGGALLV